MATTSETPMPRTRNHEREQFLADVLSAAIENGGYGWFAVEEYRWESVPLGDAYAVITPDDDEETTHRIDLDIITRGLNVIRRAVPQIDPRHQDDGPELHNHRTGERLYMSSAMRHNILLAERTNGEDADLDCLDAMAVVECGLFGRVTYA